MQINLQHMFKMSASRTHACIRMSLAYRLCVFGGRGRCVFGGLCVDMWPMTNGTLYQSSKTLKTIRVSIVTGLPRLYRQCTNGVPIVKNSQKQSKDSQNSKNDPWCTNRHRTTKTVPTVYKSSKTVKRQSKEQKWGVKVKGELNSTLKNIWLTMKIYV